MSDYSIFASALPGFENVTQSELARLGIPMAESTAGGVTFRGGLREMLTATVWSRTISHVLCRIGSFQATKLPELRRKAAVLPWCDFISPQSAVNVRATCHRSRLYHSDAVAQRVEQAITDAIPGVVASADDDCFRVAVRMQHDQCTVSIDVASTPLHRRGYRLRTAKAPLAEHIAAATLLWLDWKTDEPLADPMCGSGTFGIEAACFARAIPSVAYAQRLSAHRWPIWRQGIFDEVLASRTQAVSKCDIHVSDHTRGAVDATRENAARAGVSEALHIECRPLQNLELLRPSGLLVCNPPYGQRIGNVRRLAALHADLGLLMSTNLRGWRLGMVTANPRLARNVGLRWDRVSDPIPHGGLRVRVYHAPAARRS
jgi:putative N6-adenine-specific DNA methylase